MSGRREYGQFCGLAAGLDLVGERWTFLIVRELLIGPARFNELGENLPGMGPNLLTHRLRTLIEYGVIEQRAVPGDARGKLYQLTEQGEQLRESLLSLARWGMQFLVEEDSAGVVRAEWGFLAVQAMVIDDLIPDVAEVYRFTVGDARFEIHVRDRAVSFQRGSAAPADLTITCDADTFVRIGARLVNPFDAIAQGLVTIDGETGAIGRCTRMLGLVG